MASKKRDDFRKAAEEATATPPAVMLDVGAVVIGEIQAVKVIRRNFGYGIQAVPIIVFANEDDGEISSFWAFHQIARSKLAELKPEVGERIAIKRLTDGNSEKYGRYHNYEILIDRGDTTPTGPVDWSEFGEPEGDELWEGIEDES